MRLVPARNGWVWLMSGWALFRRHPAEWILLMLVFLLISGFIALATLGMGVLCGSMPYKALRGAVSKGLPVLTGCVGAAAFAVAGDEIEVDFATGEAINHTSGKSATFPAMPEVLREIIANGGAPGQLAAWLAQHPEQRAAPCMPSALYAGTPVKVAPSAPA